MQISVERNDQSKSSAVFYWLLIRSRARQRNTSSFTDVHFWTCKYMRRKTNVCRFRSLITQISFNLWFLRFVYLNVYSISWTLSLNKCLRRFTLECRLIFPSTGKHVQYTQTDTIRQTDGPLVPMVGLVPIEKDVIPMVLLVNMHLIKGT